MEVSRDIEREFSLLNTACVTSGYQTNGFMQHVADRLQEGERKYGSSFVDQDTWNKIMESSADVAGWALLQFDKLEAYKQAGADSGKIYYLETVLAESLKEIARVHTNLATASKIAAELENELP